MNAFDLNPGMFIVPRSTPVSAWTGHIPAAGWLVAALRPGLLVELGTHAGASFFAFCQATRASGHEGRCYAVDTWQGDEHAGLYDESIYTAVRDHLAEHYSGFASMMRMTFDEAVSYFADGSIDLLHIDGLHTYEAVRHDFETWLPKMSERGVILFHDTCVREREFGVWKLWSELRERYPSFEFSHTHGLGVLAVGAEVPSSLQSLWSVATDTEAAANVNTLFEFLGTLIVRGQQVGDLLRRQVHLDGDNGHLRNLLGIRESEQAARELEMAQAHEVLEAEKSEIAARLGDALRRVEAELEAAKVAGEGVARKLEEVEERRNELLTQLSDVAAQIEGMNALLRDEREMAGRRQQEATERDATINALEQALAAAEDRLSRVEGSVGWKVSSALASVLTHGKKSR
jgi:ligand-binding sensor protein